MVGVHFVGAHLSSNPPKTWRRHKNIHVEIDFTRIYSNSSALQIDGCLMNFPFRMAYFQGRTVSFGVGYGVVKFLLGILASRDSLMCDA